MSGDTTDGTDTPVGQFETELIAVLSELDASVKPWKLRPPENADAPAKLLVGARPSLVRSRLEDAGYEVRDLRLPVECDGWIIAWAVSP